LTLLVLVGAIGVVAAQHAGPGMHHRGGPGEMMGHLMEFGLFPPDFVLKNQTALGLSDKQILAITKDVGATHDKFQSMRDGIQPLAEQLHQMLSQDKVDEAAAVALASQLHDQE